MIRGRGDLRFHPAPLCGCIWLAWGGLTMTEGLVKTASDSPRI